tara:strand:- start:34536 stop:35582 length:1047 start_codon:yes stop_codon:yes gene_type:complete
MKLLTFAHRAEAQAFLKYKNWTSVETTPFNLYQHNSHLLLITGEGIENAMVSTSWACSKYAVQEILNFGICGSLSEENAIGSIHHIRTCYREASNSKMSFKSFSSNESGNIDIISTSSRIFNDTQADFLDNFATLIDRELWGIGFSAFKLNLPFKSYKMVSDIVGENEGFCEIIKEKANEWSEGLLDIYINMTDHDEKSETRESHLFDNPLFNDFYFTVSQKRKFYSYLKIIHARGYSIDSFFNDHKLLNQENDPQKLKRSKDATKEILNKIEKILFPHNAAIDGEIKKLQDDLLEEQIRITFHPEKETDEFHLNMRLENEVDFENKIKKLGQINLNKIFTLFRGNDV